MSVEQSRTSPTLSKSFINLSSIMDARTLNNPNHTLHGKSSIQLDYCRTFSQGHNWKMSRYFTLESLFLLVFLTASLLILPLVLPPLPPPPFLLLLLPICMLALLMVLAFMPSNARGATYTYA